MPDPSSPIPPAVVVVSSFVARGGVGARATFVLERLGHLVWTVPTVILPYHPGHFQREGKGTRIVPEAGAFAALIGDLRRSSFLAEVGAVVTGYLGDAAQAEAVAGLVAAVKAANPQAFYLCDPVIGDGAGLYVPLETAIAIRDTLLPLADIATPNRFELGWLTGRDITTPAEAAAAARAIGPATVAVTSAPALLKRSAATMLATREQVIVAEHPQVEAAPNGPGDLFAMLLAAGRLAGRSGEALLRQAAAATFEAVALSVRLGADEMMLAAAQGRIVQPMATLALRRLEVPAGGAGRKVITGE